MSTFRMSFDISGLERALEADKQAVAESVRPAAQAGAQVLYEAVKSNVSRIKKKTGNLAASIYQAYSESQSGPAKAAYHIAPNHKKAPHWWLVEYGHYQRYEVTKDPETGRFFTHKDRPLATPKHVPGRPYIRPAKDKMPQAIAAMEARFFEELKKRGVTR